MGKNISVTFEVGAKTMGTVASTFATVESRIGNLKQSAKELQTFQTKAAALTTATARLEAKKAAYASAPTAALKKELDAAQKAFNSAERSAGKYNITVANSAKVQAQTTAAIHKTEAALARQEKLFENQAKRRELHGRMVGTVATAMTVAAPIKLAMDAEEAEAGLKKVTNFDASGFQRFTADLKKLSTEIPMTYKGMLEIAANAGVAEEELLSFTKDAAIMGVAFDMSAEQAANAMKGLRTNLHLNRDGMTGLGDAFNRLANAMKVNASSVIEFTNRAAGVGTLYGITGQQMGAMGTAFTKMNVAPERAAMSFNALTTVLNTVGDTTDKKVIETFKRLGLPVKEMSALFKDDAQSAILLFLEAIKKSKDPVGDLHAIMGAGYFDEVSLLASGLDTYKESLSLVADASSYAGSMMEEFKNVSGTSTNYVVLMKNAVSSLAVTIGTNLLSPLKTVAGAAIAVVNQITAFAAAYPTVTTVVLAGGVALASLMVVTLAGAYAATILSDGFTVFKGVIAKLPSKTQMLTKAQWLLNAAMRANPVALVITAVAALAVGLYVLYQKSETFRMVVGKVWGVIKAVGRQVLPVLLFPFVAAWEGIKMAREPAKAFFSLLWNGIKTVARIYWTVISTTVTTVWSAIKTVWNGAVSFFSTLWEAIKAPAIALWETVAAAATWCVNLFRPLWEPVVAVFAGVWEGIKAPAVAVFDWIGAKFDWVAGKFQWLSDTWAKVNGWFSDDEEGLTVAQAETKVKAAETVAARPTVVAEAARSFVPQSVSVPAASFSTTQTVVQGTPAVAVPSYDQLTMPKYEAPAPQIQAPVTQEFNITLHGVPDKEFAQRVVEAIKSQRAALQEPIAKIVADIMSHQKRLAYD